MGEIIDGKAIAREIEAGLKAKLAGRQPGITMVLVGEHPASEVYVRMKGKAAERVGMHSEILRLPKETSEDELIEEIGRLNRDKSVDGILIQLPLPKQISGRLVMMEIDPLKDVDGFHPMNMGKLLLGDEGGFVPCTPAGVHYLLSVYDVDTCGKHVVILGRSNIVGKPLAALLMQKRKGCNATVTVAHSQTSNLEELCLSADILIAAMGRPKSIDRVKKGAVVIDVGISRTEEGLAGDIDFEKVKEQCSLITPVPGGVGPMTVAMLLKNTCDSYFLRVSA